jgi:hypothetical protein
MKMTRNGRIGNMEGSLLGDSGTLSKTVRKVVAIFIKSQTEENDSTRGEEQGTDRLTINGCSGNGDRVMGTEVVELENSRVVFWILSKTLSGSLGFELSFLQGAAIAVVMMELSDWKTIRSSAELLRNICREFSIPVMLVVGGKIAYDNVGSDLFVELAKTVSRVASCPQHALFSK